MDKQTFEYMKARTDAYQNKKISIESYERAIRRIESYNGENLAIEGNYVTVPKTLFPIMIEHIKQAITKVEEEMKEI